MTPPRLFIEFLDHEWKLDRSWHDRTDAEADAQSKMPTCWAVGFLVGETEQAVTIAATMNEHEFGPYFCVLKCCIVRREELIAKTETHDGQ
jgi:hypothetical protein